MIALIIFIVSLAGGILLTDIPQLKSVKDKLAPYSSLTGFVLLIFGAINVIYGFLCLFGSFFFGICAMIAGLIAIHAGGVLYMGLSFIPREVDDIISKITKPILAITAPLKPFVGYALLAVSVFYFIGMIF